MIPATNANDTVHLFRYVHSSSAAGDANPKISTMSKERIFGDDKIPCKGKVIIHHLDYARRLLTALHFKEEERGIVAQEQSKELEVIILEVADLCCNSDHWSGLYEYLLESGIEVTQEFNLRKMYLERVMDENPADANRN